MFTWKKYWITKYPLFAKTNGRIACLQWGWNPTWQFHEIKNLIIKSLICGSIRDKWYILYNRSTYNSILNWNLGPSYGRYVDSYFFFSWNISYIDTMKISQFLSVFYFSFFLLFFRFHSNIITIELNRSNRKLHYIL